MQDLSPSGLLSPYSATQESGSPPLPQLPCCSYGQTWSADGAQNLIESKFPNSMNNGGCGLQGVRSTPTSERIHAVTMAWRQNPPMSV